MTRLSRPQMRSAMNGRPSRRTWPWEPDDQRPRIRSHRKRGVLSFKKNGSCKRAGIRTRGATCLILAMMLVGPFSSSTCYAGPVRSVVRAVKDWVADDQREMPKGDALRNDKELLERREDEPITLKFAGCLILCVSFGFWGH